MADSSAIMLLYLHQTLLLEWQYELDLALTLTYESPLLWQNGLFKEVSVASYLAS